MLVDLHIHTYFSDGTMSPEEVADEAKKSGLEIVAVADHNSTEGSYRFETACRKNGLYAITAVELDVMMNERYLHLLAYGFDRNDPCLSALIHDCKTSMNYGNDVLIYNMAKEFANIDPAEYQTYHYSLDRGGHKHTNYLMDKGIIHSHREVFAYFDQYGIPLVDLHLPQLDQACIIIRNAGGYAVLAHPGSTLSKVQFQSELLTVIDNGIDGIECFYPSHSKEITDLCIDVCRTNDLLITAGSDSHGRFTNRNIGAFKVDTRDLNLKEVIK